MKIPHPQEPPGFINLSQGLQANTALLPRLHCLRISHLVVLIGLQEHTALNLQHPLAHPPLPQHRGRMREFSPEELLSMILTYLMETAEAYLEGAVQGAATVSGISYGVTMVEPRHEPQFEHLYQDLFRSICEPIEKVLRDAKIIKLVSDLFDGKQPTTVQHLDPDATVAYGAALQAAVLSGNTIEQLQEFILLDQNRRPERKARALRHELLSKGSITRPVFGHSALIPKWDEDFNVAPSHPSIASMEATAVAGLGNEVSGVTGARPVDFTRTCQHELVWGELEIDRAGVSAHEQRGKRCVASKGFANEAHRRQGPAWRTAVEKVRGLPGSLRERSTSIEIVEGLGQLGDVVEDPYERFIRGEPVSDDEDDDDFHPDDEGTPQPATDSDDSGDEEDSDEGADDDKDEVGEQARLYADLSQSDAAQPRSCLRT
ncbi:hypothetical protein LXA43DRAFT_1098728 [Ganoderma leucocontextum]|nr:hypothetical protein LXA43DRAFT_1098728 [Ganoderma leucocontextum]